MPNACQRGQSPAANVRAADVVSSVAQLWISVVGRGADRRCAARRSSTVAVACRNRAGPRRLRRDRILGLTGDSQAVFSRSSRSPDIVSNRYRFSPRGGPARRSPIRPWRPKDARRGRPRQASRHQGVDAL